MYSVGVRVYIHVYICIGNGSWMAEEGVYAGERAAAAQYHMLSQRNLVLPKSDWSGRDLGLVKTHCTCMCTCDVT